MPLALSVRAQEILAEIERESQRRRPVPREGTPSAPAPSPLDPAPSGDLDDVLELVDAATEECRRLQSRLAHLADALGEVARHVRATGPPDRPT